MHVYVCMYGYKLVTAHMWKTEDNFWELSFSFHLVDPWDEIRLSVLMTCMALSTKSFRLTPLGFWFLFCLVWDRVSHWSGTQQLDLVGWPVNIRSPPVSTSWALRIQAYTTSPVLCMLLHVLVLYIYVQCTCTCALCVKGRDQQCSFSVSLHSILCSCMYVEFVCALVHVCEGQKSMSWLSSVSPTFI